MIKRLLDISAAAVLLVILSPVILLVAVAVRMLLGQPVLFVQERPGLYGHPFSLVKFRSMLDASDANGEVLSDGERLTGFGRFLRKSSLDELPELWNVLKGDMSLVGPRPLLMEYLPRYTREQMRRHHVRPGITGWAQVNGRNEVDWDERFKLDVWYVDHASVLLDLKILLMTLKMVIAGTGVSQKGHATREKFRGDKE